MYIHRYVLVIVFAVCFANGVGYLLNDQYDNAASTTCSYVDRLGGY